MATTDFFGNLGQIIHDILGTANKIYRDMADVGDHKKRAKYRYTTFASFGERTSIEKKRSFKQFYLFQSFSGSHLKHSCLCYQLMS